MSNNSIALSVPELTARIKQVLEQGFAQIELTGEISRLTTPSSGHLYFTIKDAHAAISAVVWRSTVMRLKTRPKEGQAFVFFGHLSLYEPRGTYQMVIKRMETVGAGRLAAEFERRKQDFAQRGWFDPDHKLPIPKLPQHIGIVASPTSAAYADVIKVLQTRPAWLQLTLSPCLVQGEQAPASAALALKRLQQLDSQPDVILIVRGGGSMEDLWCFNDERIIKAMFDCPIPILSGIGHEIDSTLSDLSADQRAATPSNAAELSCPSRESLQQRLPKRASMIHALQRRLHLLAQQLNNISQRQEHAINRLKDDKHWAAERLNHQHQAAFKQYLKLQYNKLKPLQTQLHYQEPNNRLRPQTQHFYQIKARFMAFKQHLSSQQRQTISTHTQHLHQFCTLCLQQKKHHWQRFHEHLHALNPLHILQRGYAIPTDKKGNIISSSQQLQNDDLLHLHFHDGVAATKVIHTHRTGHKKQ